jgi:hypothetical protein
MEEVLRLRIGRGVRGEEGLEDESMAGGESTGEDEEG